MPIQHSLHKVQKTITKSKGAMHPKGRKFKQLNRATLREQKIQNKKMEHVERKEIENLRIVFLQEAVQNREEQETFSLDDMKLFIEAFLSRDDEEIEQLQSERRKGRPPTNRQLLLENKKKHEQSEYLAGYQIPDLSDKLTVELLRSWNGTNGMLNKFKYIFVSKTATHIQNKDAEMQQ
jgi:translation machinery-associated protein 16